MTGAPSASSSLPRFPHCGAASSTSALPVMEAAAGSLGTSVAGAEAEAAMLHPYPQQQRTGLVGGLLLNPHPLIVGLLQNPLP